MSTITRLANQWIRGWRRTLVIASAAIIATGSLGAWSAYADDDPTKPKTGAVRGNWPAGADIYKLQRGLNGLNFGVLAVDGNYGRCTDAAFMRFNLAYGGKGDRSFLLGLLTLQVGAVQGAVVKALKDKNKPVGNSDTRGDYGDNTRRQVLEFQKAEGIDRDEIAGKQTIGRLMKWLDAEKKTTIRPPDRTVTTCNGVPDGKGTKVKAAPVAPVDPAPVGPKKLCFAFNKDKATTDTPYIGYEVNNDNEDKVVDGTYCYIGPNLDGSYNAVATNVEVLKGKRGSNRTGTGCIGKPFAKYRELKSDGWSDWESDDFGGRRACHDRQRYNTWSKTGVKDVGFDLHNS